MAPKHPTSFYKLYYRDAVGLADMVCTIATLKGRHASTRHAWVLLALTCPLRAYADKDLGGAQTFTVGAGTLAGWTGVPENSVHEFLAWADREGYFPIVGETAPGKTPKRALGWTLDEFGSSVDGQGVAETPTVASGIPPHPTPEAPGNRVQGCPQGIGASGTQHMSDIHMGPAGGLPGGRPPAGPQKGQGPDVAQAAPTPEDVEAYRRGERAIRLAPLSTAPGATAFAYADGRILATSPRGLVPVEELGDGPREEAAKLVGELKGLLEGGDVL